MKCPFCNAEIEDHLIFCPACGARLHQEDGQAAQPAAGNDQYANGQQYGNGQYANGQQYGNGQYANGQQYGNGQYAGPQYYQQPCGPDPMWPARSKMAAGILAILLGDLGVHKFYMGKIGMGILYLVFCWTGVPAIIGLVEGIIYLTSSRYDFEMKNHVRCTDSSD